MLSLRLLLLLLLAWPPASQAELPEAVAGKLRAAGIPDDALGVLVLRLADGAPLLSQGAERSMQPGSTMKLLTTQVAMDRLGPTYRGRSELRSSGPIMGNVLKGDLVLRGGADSDLTWEAFQGMLQTLRNRGVELIDGDLLLDRTYFNPPRPDVGAGPFDEAPEFEYNLIPDAILLNSNLLRFELQSDQSQVRVSMMPPLDRVSVSTDMLVSEQDCADWDKDWLPPEYVRDADGWIRVLLHGKFPRNCARTTAINVLDRVDFADRLFRILWTRMGGKFTGSTREAAAPPDARLLVDHQSRPWPVVMRDINKSSDNALSRLIYLVMGARSATDLDKGSPTAALSDRVARGWLKQRGIDDIGLVLENGSGLSRIERISPAQLAAVLSHASRTTFAPEFVASLPIAGVDGTMRLRLLDSPAAGHARLKTGTLNGVHGIAGYLPDAAGRMHVMVAFLNHPLASNALGRSVLDALADWVARSGAESR